MGFTLYILVGLVTVAAGVLAWGLVLAAGDFFDYWTIEKSGRHEPTPPREVACIIGYVVWGFTLFCVGLAVLGWLVTTVGGLFL